MFRDAVDIAFPSVRQLAYTCRSTLQIHPTTGLIQMQVEVRAEVRQAEDRTGSIF